MPTEMNNQAAQTMPELPEPWTIRYHDDATGREIGPPTPLYTADQMHQYARDYALSQTAGVVEGWKLVPVEPTEAMCEAAMSSLGWSRSQAAATAAPITPASPMMEGAMKVWSGMLAAAPAASGVHPDALPDGTLSKSTAKRVEALASASVSERARELLALAYEDAGRDLAADDLRKRFKVGRDSDIALRAIEQALTQQRGEVPAAGGVPFGHYWVWKDGTAQFLLGQSNWALESACKSVTPLYTTPQPSADAVRELVKRWRACAKSAANGPMFDGASEYAVAGTYIDCADELESLLSGGSHA